MKREDYISQAATLPSWSPRALNAPQFPQGSAGLPQLLCVELSPSSLPLACLWRKAKFRGRPGLTSSSPNKSAGQFP